MRVGEGMETERGMKDDIEEPGVQCRPIVAAGGGAETPTDTRHDQWPRPCLDRQRCVPDSTSTSREKHIPSCEMHVFRGVRGHARRDVARHRDARNDERRHEAGVRLAQLAKSLCRIRWFG